MRVVVTRPAADAARWVADLQARGCAALALPLIDIAPVDSGDARRALERAAVDLARGQYAAAMFSSGNAVTHFFANRGLPWPDATRAWAPGPGTARALREAGVPSAGIDAPADDAAQFDSEHLWALTASQIGPGTRVLCVRGGDAQGAPRGRDWLAARVRSAGGVWSDVVAYRRLPPAWTPAQRAEADGSARTDLWLFSSSEAVANLRHLMPERAWQDARALTTHPRIAQAAREAGFGSVTLSQPTLDALVASIESLR